MRRYLNPEFRYDKYSENCESIRIEGCGELRFSCCLDSENRIVNPFLNGDFFATDGLQTLLCKLEGVKFVKEDLQETLKPIEVSSVISGLDVDTLIKVILETKLKTI